MPEDEEAGLEAEDGEEDEEYAPEPVRRWAEDRQPEAVVHVETGRGNAVDVPVGSPFIDTIYRIAEDVHYGGDFRVYLNGSLLLDEADAPETVEAGMRIALTPYDKPGC